MRILRLSTRSIIAVTAVSLVLSCSKGDAPQKKAPAAAQPPAPTQPAPAPAPVVDAGVAAAKPVEPPKPMSPLVAATASLPAAQPGQAQVTLAQLRQYIDANPTAEDLAATAKLLATTAVTKAADALAAGDATGAQKIAATVLGAKGGLSINVKNGLVTGREAIEAALSFAAAPDLDKTADLAEIAGGASTAAPAAKKMLEATVAPVRKAFDVAGPPEARLAAITAARAPGAWSLCAEQRGKPDAAIAACDPVFYGLKDKDALSALTPAAASALRLRVLASTALAGGPKGLLELPLPTTGPVAPGAEYTGESPLETVVLDAAGVHLTTRPVVQLDSDQLVSGGAWPGKTVLTAEALKAVAKPEELQPLVDALKALRAQTAPAEKAVYGDSKAVNGAREEGTWAANVVLAKDAPASSLTHLIAALKAAGYSDLRYARGGDSNGRSTVALPADSAMVPADRAGREEKRTIVVHLKAGSADVFPATGKGEAPGQEQAPVAMPGGMKRWYKGTRVAKYSTRDDALLVDAVRFVRQRDKASTVVTVIPAADVTAQRYLAVAAKLAAAPGVAQKTLSAVFPGQKCPDEAPEYKGPCRSLFPVLNPAADVPSSAGLTEEPTKKEKKEKKVEPKKEEPKKEAAPKPGFCNKADIARVIKGRKGAIKFCYERKLSLYPDLKGKVIARINIGGNGGVTSVSTSGSMSDKGVHKCVKKVVQKLNFKPPEGGGSCVVRWPFNFQP